VGNGRNYSEAYYRKPKWITTWSRIPVEEVYTPQNTNARDYSRELNDPGEYPYTRGIYPDMYRGRLWTVRQISAHSSAEESNRRLQFLFDAGEGGINVIADIPTQIWLDSDHPMAEASVGVQGAPLCTLLDMEALMEGLPIEQLSTTFSTLCPVTLAQYLAVAEKSVRRLTLMI
jgi:methylmalonyl-CoA mutase N-terminal domain/subunit